MSWIVWREADDGTTEYFARFRRNTVVWSHDRADAREFPNQRDAIDARADIADRVHATRIGTTKAAR